MLTGEIAQLRGREAPAPRRRSLPMGAGHDVAGARRAGPAALPDLADPGHHRAQARPSARCSRAARACRPSSTTRPRSSTRRTARGASCSSTDRFEVLHDVERDEVVGKTDHELFPGETADAMRADDLKVLHAGLTLELEEVSSAENGPRTYLTTQVPAASTRPAPGDAVRGLRHLDRHHRAQARRGGAAGERGSTCAQIDQHGAGGVRLDRRDRPDHRPGTRRRSDLRLVGGGGARPRTSPPRSSLRATARRTRAVSSSFLEHRQGPALQPARSSSRRCTATGTSSRSR